MTNGAWQRRWGIAELYIKYVSTGLCSVQNEPRVRSCINLSLGDHLVLLTTLEITTMWVVYIGTKIELPSVYAGLYTMWLIALYQIAKQ